MPTSAANRSGNPAKRTSAPKAASSPTDFKTKAAGGLVVLPSGLSARIRRLDLTTLLSENMLGDNLSVIAQKAVDKGQGITGAEKDALTADPKLIREMLTTFDKVTIRAWMEPKVLPVPDIEDERDEDLLYADEVDLQDKMFTFNYLSGGSTDLVRFRAEFAEPLEGIPAGEGVVVPAQ